MYLECQEENIKWFLEEETMHNQVQAFFQDIRNLNKLDIFLNL